MAKRNRSKARPKSSTPPIRNQQRENARRIPNANLAKVLILDIETTPLVSYTWSRYDTHATKVLRDREIFCVGWKWAGQRQTKCLGTWDYAGWKPNTNDSDNYLAQTIRSLLDEADIVVAHNGKAFDVPIMLARIAHYDILQPSPFRQVDTKKVASAKLGFTSNSLKDLLIALNAPEKFRKIDPGGIELWHACNMGDVKAQRKMMRYCKRDVDGLEWLYLRLRPYDDYHPNVALNSLRGPRCPACGSLNVISRGWTNLKSWRARRYVCNDCGKWSKGEREKIRVQVLT